VLLELDGHSLRAGILTQKPALPFTFIPFLCAAHSENDHFQFVAAGKEAILAGRQKNYSLVESIKVISLSYHTFHFCLHFRFLKRKHT
jgi:hypothetical protein